MLPLSFVEGKGFEKLMQYMEPEYTVPTHKTITSQLEIHHCKMKEEMQQAFEGAEYVAITLDGWTSMTTESYMTITCHVDKGISAAVCFRHAHWRKDTQLKTWLPTCELRRERGDLITKLSPVCMIMQLTWCWRMRPCWTGSRYRYLLILCS